jgi:hypothetical protein
MKRAAAELDWLNGLNRTEKNRLRHSRRSLPS